MIATVRARLGRQTVFISPDSAAVTAGELAAACGLDALAVDGRAVPAFHPLTQIGLLDGAVLSAEPAAPAAPAGWEAVVVTGPDSGARVALPTGRHVLGRAPSARIALADPHLEPHHVAVILAADAPTVTQLTGRTPIALEARAGALAVRAGASRIDIRRRDSGATTVTPGDAGAGTPAAPWHRDHHRPIRPAAPDEAPAIAGPDMPIDGASVAVPAAILPAILGAAAAAVMAVVMHQPLILLFGLSAVVVAAGTWAAQHVSGVRRRRANAATAATDLARFGAELDAQAAADADRLRAIAPDVDVALDRIARRARSLWERRPAHPDAWQIVLGRGESPWQPRVTVPSGDGGSELEAIIARRAVLADVPVTTMVGPGDVLGLGGRGAAGVARSIVIQLAANCGPADWGLLVVSERPQQWQWVDWLPHDTVVVGAADVGAEALAAVDRDRHLLTIVDAPGALASRTSPLRRLLAAEPRPAVVAIADEADGLPGFCTSLLTLPDHGVARWFADARAFGLPLPLEPAGITIDRAADAAARLAHRRDPEMDAGGAAVPRRVDVVGLLGAAVTDASSIALGWELAGADPAPVATLGDAADGRIEVDLCRDGPHTLIGGTTGAGKSELLRTLLVSLAVATPPELLSFVLVDYKGGAAFDACAALPHVAGLVTDLDERLAARALRSLDAELHRRERLLRDAGAPDLSSYRALPGRHEPLARLVVVVDEFATLAADLPEFLSSLVGIAQRGRSLGVHLVLATQRPGAAINDDIRGNTNLRISLRVQDAAEAIDIVGDRTPSAFARTTPGRAMLRLGSDERVVFQVASTADPMPPERRAGLRVAFAGHDAEAGQDAGAAPAQLDALVARIRDAAADRPAARAVWQPVLPPTATADDLVAVATSPDVPCVGVLDDPAGQRRLSLGWDHRLGHLLVAGSLGSGTTSAAITVVRALAARHAPESLHVFVLDGRGDARLSELASLDHCAGVIGHADAERLERTVRLLHARTRERQPEAADVVVVIDGLPAVRSAVDALGGDLHERFDGVIADGPACGVTAIVTTDQTVLPLALSARTSQRWIMRLADPTAAALLDLPAREALDADAPAGRLMALPERAEGQLAAPDVARAWTPRRGTGPAALVHLPERVGLRSLPAPRAGGERTWLPVGLDAALVQPTGIELADGDHLLVLGTARSGRSTTLGRLAGAWSQAHPGAPIVAVTPRRSPLAALAAARGWTCVTERGAGPGPAPTQRTLLLVDDAELNDHPDLAAWCTAPAATVFAASRPDALRGAYQHWTQAVRRSRTGLVLGRTTELDGDLLGVVLPRRWPVPRAAGRGWLVDEGACRGVVQVAIDDDAHLPDGRTGGVPLG